MSLLSAHNLSLSFGAFDVFRGATVSISRDSKIGLIGPNGIGKTSLLLILAGLRQPTGGTVHIARSRRLGYLRQEAVEAFAARETSLYAEMMEPFAGLQDQQKRLHAMEAAMAAGDYSPELLEKYGVLQETFAQAGGYEIDVTIQRTLQGLGLGPDHWPMPIRQLSGGQKTRALLARLLLERPELLILDEPTNHLDAEAVQWLERTLRDWPGALLVVSHDRYFLDNVVNTIWEMSREGIETYTGAYTSYLSQRQERRDWQLRVYQEEKARLEKELEFVQRNLARASTHDRAFGLLRRLSRDLAIVEQMGVTALRNGPAWGEMGLEGSIRPLGVAEAARLIHSLPAPVSRPPRLKLRLSVHQASGAVVLRAQKLVVGYPGFPLFSAGQIELRRGECVALTGPNGSGKTTFLKTLLGQVSPLEGRLSLDPSLRVGYFAQAHDNLDSERTVLEELLRHREIPEEQARGHLAQYLFRSEDVFKPVSALSGGERARLALAILALEGANFLLLDEPTNHLDIPAQEALQEVLESFPGAILLVSHDRYLIDRLATQIWDLHGGRLHIFQGHYSEWLARGASPARPDGAQRKPAVALQPSRSGQRAQNPRRSARQMTETRRRP